ncbi:carbohydrate ABC transporter permease [Mobilitalea sibirica]|nr:sugar ABC transporter permease [Mobilitalea sibirica]
MRPYLFIAPSVLGLLIFYIMPFMVNVSYCFTLAENDSVTPLNLFRNIGHVFTSYSFQLALKNNALFLLLAMPAIIIVSFLLALLLLRVTVSNAVFRTAFFMPLVIPTAATIIVFQILFEQSGFINHVLRVFNMNTVDFLDSRYSLLIMVIIYVWKYCGYNMLLFIVGINAIPKEYYEAAKIDGAGKIKCMYYITLKLIKSTMFFVIIMSLINSFKIFREVYLLTGDYPSERLYLLQHYLNNNFRNFNYQNLSIASLMTFTFVMLILGFLYLRRNRIEKGE